MPDLTSPTSPRRARDKGRLVTILLCSFLAGVSVVTLAWAIRAGTARRLVSQRHVTIEKDAESSVEFTVDVPAQYAISLAFDRGKPVENGEQRRVLLKYSLRCEDFNVVGAVGDSPAATAVFAPTSNLDFGSAEVLQEFGLLNAKPGRHYQLAVTFLETSPKHNVLHPRIMVTTTGEAVLGLAVRGAAAAIVSLLSFVAAVAMLFPALRARRKSREINAAMSGSESNQVQA